MEVEVNTETELWVVYTLTHGQRMTPESISEELAIDITQEEIKQSLESLEDQGKVEHEEGWKLKSN